MNRRMNPMIIRQQSTMESPNGPSSPAISPLHPRHVRTGSNGISNAKTKAAAQRLAQVMSNQQADDDEEDEDEFAYDFSASSRGSIGLAGGRRVTRPKSPVMKKSLQVDTCSPTQSVIKKSPSVDAISPVQTKKSQSMDVGISVQMKKSRPVDDDEDFVDDYGLVTGPVTIGRAGGKPTRNPSPMKSQLVDAISPAQVKKSQPVDVVSPAQMMKSQLVDEEEDDYGLVTDPVSIGRVRGRTMKNPSSMKSQPIDVVSSVQVKKSQPVDAVSPAQMKNSRLVNDEEDDYGLVTGPVSIGRVGGRTMKNPSPMKSQPVDVVSSVQVKKSQPIDVVSPTQMKKSQPVNDEDDDYGLVIGPVTIGRAGGRSMRSRTPMKSQPVDVVSPAQVKKSQLVNDEEYDFANDYGLVTGPVTIGHAGGRSMRNRSPMMVRTKQEQPVFTNSTTSNKSSQSINFIEQPSLTVPSVSPTTPSQSTNKVEQSSFAHSLMVGRSSVNSIEQPLSVRSSFSIRSSPNSNEQPPSSRSTSASRSNIKPVPMPSSVPISLKQVSPVIASEPLVDNWRDKRASIDFGGANLSNISSHQSTSTLQDEVKMLQEANENLMEKLRLTEERCDKAEERARQLEKQVVALGVGEGISLKAEFEAKSLHSVMQRVILTQEEMEEVVLKRCWLARYWNLCVQHGIHVEVAEARYEYWSSFAPLPIEVVLAAGQRAREENSLAANNDADRRDKALQDMSELSGDGNIESMLAVEKGLRELAFLKVEDAVALAMAQQRRPTSLRTDEVKLPAEGHFEAFELSQDESEDVRFKQAWLTYFWRRAKDHGIELDIAEERLQCWINHNNRSCTSHDAVDVERGLLELRKLGIENQLWQNLRK